MAVVGSVLLLKLLRVRFVLVLQAMLYRDDSQPLANIPQPATPAVSSSLIFCMIW